MSGPQVISPVSADLVGAPIRLCMTRVGVNEWCAPERIWNWPYKPSSWPCNPPACRARKPL